MDYNEILQGGCAEVVKRMLDDIFSRVTLTKRSIKTLFAILRYRRDIKGLLGVRSLSKGGVSLKSKHLNTCYKLDAH